MPSCNASTWRQRHEDEHKFEASQTSYDDPTHEDKIKAQTKMTTSDGNGVGKDKHLDTLEGM